MRAAALACAATLALGFTGCGAATAAGARATPGPPDRPAPCATRAPALIPRNPWPAARAKLAPAGAVAIRLCRYSGDNARPPRHLTASRLVRARATVSRLVGEFDRLPSARGTFACPVDDGSQIVALLAYPGRHAVAIRVGLRGCNLVINGDLARTAAGRSGAPGPRLLAQLERLTARRG